MKNINTKFSLTLKNSPKNIVIVTGLSRSGKSMLAPILSSLKRAETLKMNYTLEQYPVLNHLGLMPDHVSIYLMRYMINFIIYDSMIGRNSNFRLSDWTSIWKSSDPRKYIERLLSEEGDSVYDKIEEKDQLNIFMFHNALWHAKIFFQSFPDLKMIHLNRHPVDVIHSWYRRGYSSEFYLKKRSALTLINFNNNNLPYYAKGWEQEYCSLSDMDRLIKMINFINSNHNKTFRELSKKNQKQVLTINFDRMVTKSKNDLKIIKSFLNTDETMYTKTVMKKERCPREIDMNERAAKFEEIKELATSDSVQLLQEMVHEYELQSSE